MDLLTPAITFIVNAFAKNKKAQEFKDDFVGGFIEWIEPIFFVDDKELENGLKEKPNDAATKSQLEEKLKVLLQDEGFKQKLQEFLDDPRGTALKSKNVFDGEIGDIDGSVKIGDKTISPEEHLNEKNIFKGKMGKIKGDFTLGDG